MGLGPWCKGGQGIHWLFVSQNQCVLLDIVVWSKSITALLKTAGFREVQGNNGCLETEGADLNLQLQYISHRLLHIMSAYWEYAITHSDSPANHRCQIYTIYSQLLDIVSVTNWV